MRKAFDINGMMQPHQIVAAATKPSAMYGYVYFLIHEKKIVYVGQTVALYTRLRQHVDSGKMFDGYYALECPREHLDLCESAYIALCNPDLNKAYPNAKTKPIEAFLGLQKKICLQLWQDEIDARCVK